MCLQVHAEANALLNKNSASVEGAVSGGGGVPEEGRGCDSGGDLPRLSALCSRVPHVLALMLQAECVRVQWGARLLNS